MHASTQVERGPFDRVEPPFVVVDPLPTRLAEFTIETAHPPRQIECLAENPLCHLAARTAAGGTVCDRGCGLAQPGATVEHVCPFGLTMRRVESDADGARSRWIGRRFATVDAMHGALDRLLDEGFDEETILSHLPPNPVVGKDEIARAAAEGRTKGEGRRAKEDGLWGEPEFDARLGADALPASKDAAPLAHLMEYLEQIQNLIAGTTRPEVVCERFLRALGGLLPFDEMAIYLADPAAGEPREWVLAASLDPLGSVAPGARAPQARPCRLGPGDAGWRACEEGRVVFERWTNGSNGSNGSNGPNRSNGTNGSRLTEESGRSDRSDVSEELGLTIGPGLIALPLPLTCGERAGVWVARTSRELPADPLGGEPVRFMRLLAEMVGMRLRLAARPAAPGDNASPCPTWDAAQLSERLQPELARASRLGASVALLRLKVSGALPNDRLPVEPLGAALRAKLRLYDQVGAVAERRAVWSVIAAVGAAESAQRIAERMQDALDAQGGLEERGLRVTVGISLWGSDATTPDKMIEHAERAATITPQCKDAGPIRVYDSQWAHAEEPAVMLTRRGRLRA
jgi:hypothetical protein